METNGIDYGFTQDELNNLDTFKPVGVVGLFGLVELLRKHTKDQKMVEWVNEQFLILEDDIRKTSEQLDVACCHSSYTDTTDLVTHPAESLVIKTVSGSHEYGALVFVLSNDFKVVIHSTFVSPETLKQNEDKALRTLQ